MEIEDKQTATCSKVQNPIDQESGKSCEASSAFVDKHVIPSENQDYPTCVNGQHSQEEAHIVKASDDYEVASLYGWVIVAASFVNCFIVGVMFIGFSILYIAFDESFKTTKGISGWIGSLYLATGNICGKLCINNFSMSWYKLNCSSYQHVSSVIIFSPLC
jgi:hypothetical protein